MVEKWDVGYWSAFGWAADYFIEEKMHSCVLILSLFAQIKYARLLWNVLFGVQHIQKHNL